MREEVGHYGDEFQELTVTTLPILRSNCTSPTYVLNLYDVLKQGAGVQSFVGVILLCHPVPSINVPSL